MSSRTQPAENKNKARNGRVEFAAEPNGKTRVHLL
jgi:hypothetical protein